METIPPYENPEYEPNNSELCTLDDAQDALLDSGDTVLSTLGLEIGGMQFSVETFPCNVTYLSREIAATRKTAFEPKPFDVRAVPIRQAQLQLADELQVAKREIIAIWATDANAFIRSYPNAVVVAPKNSNGFEPLTQFIYVDDALYLQTETGDTSRIYELSEETSRSLQVAVDIARLPADAQKDIREYLANEI